MATMRWTTSRTSVHNPGYHIIFCPNYRRPMLGPSVGHKCWGGEIRERVLVLYNEKAVELGVSMETQEVMPNPVHLLVRTSPVPALHCLSGQMKGYTVRNLWATFPSLISPLPSMWTYGDYNESVGQVCKDAIKKTIEEQRGQ